MILILTYDNGDTRHLRFQLIRAGIYRVFIDRLIIKIKYAEAFNLSRRSDGEYTLIGIMKNIEERYNADREQDKRMLIVKDMFSVITKEVLEEYFTDFTDTYKYSINKATTMNDIDIFWRILIKTEHILIGDKENIIMDDTHIDMIDSLITISKRLRELFDISFAYKFGKFNSVNTLIITILANDKDGKSIGSNLVL